MKTVLHINDELNICSGITKYILIAAKYSGDGLNHIALALRGDADILFARKNIRFINMNMDISDPVSLLRFTIRLKHICMDNDVRIIHCHHRFSDLICTTLHYYFKVKTVTTVHSCVRGFRRISYRSGMLIAVSPAVKEHLTDYFRKNPRRVKMVYNKLVEKEINDSLQECTNEDLSGTIPAGRIILYVGRICFEKGTDILIEAFGQLRTEFPDLRLMLIGRDESGGAITARIENDHDVFIISPRQPVYQYYRIAELAVLPSRTDSMPYAMLEAGYFGVPFVGSDTGGIRDVVENGVDGLLFRPGNVSQLRQQIGIMLRYRNSALKMAESFRRKIRRDFCFNEYTPVQKEIYSSPG